MQWLANYQQSLAQQWQTGRLPHAIMFSGIDGSGKQALAQWLISLLACQRQNAQPQAAKVEACGQCKACLLLAHNNHPDHQQLIVSGKTIGVDEIRAVSRFFEKTAQLGGARTFVIADAEKMTVSAANALLKTLEEPNQRCFLVLLTRDAKLLLPTIISRCRVIEIKSPTGTDLYTTSAEHAGSAFENISHAAELNDDAIQQQLLALEAQLFSFLTTGQGLSALIINLQQQTHALRWLEKILVNWLRQAHQWQPSSKITGRFSSDDLWQCYQKIIARNKQIKQYNQANQDFIIEQLMTEFEQVLSQGKK